MEHMIIATVIGYKILNYSFKKHALGYLFYLDDIQLGYVVKKNKNEWSATVSLFRCEHSIVHGFSSRSNAAEYLCQVCREKVKEILNEQN